MSTSSMLPTVKPTATSVAVVWLPNQAGTLMDYDENQWAAALNYHQESIKDSLSLFQWLRSKTYTLVKSLPDSAWSNTAHHPENGDMTLDDWLDVYESHVREHVEYMQQNYEARQQQR